MSLLSEMFAGAGASAITSAILYPVDLVKIRLQSQLKEEGQKAVVCAENVKCNSQRKKETTFDRKYTSASDAARKISKSEGAAGFYVGVVPYVLRQAWGDAVNLGQVSRLTFKNIISQQ